MILTILPIGLNWYELAVDALIFDLEYVWSSAGMGALYTLVWATFRIRDEWFRGKSFDDLFDPKALSAFIYWSKPNLGKNWFAQLLVNSIVFVGL